MKRLLVLLMVCLLCVQGFTQSTRKIRELEKQHAELQKQISCLLYTSDAADEL